MSVFSAGRLIEEFGQKVSDRACRLCSRFTLFAIRYPDRRGTVFLCQNCDLAKDS